MLQISTSRFINRLNHHDLMACELSNKACRHLNTERFFAIVSRLGDGALWYGLIISLPLIYGMGAIPASLVMILVGLGGLCCYKWLKAGTTRPRPYTVSEQIRLGTAPLDQFSFPSGHTLHAVGFTLVSCNQYPELGWVLIPFAGLIATSRIVLGLHYPSDVLAGAALGALFGLLGLTLI